MNKSKLRFAVGRYGKLIFTEISRKAQKLGLDKQYTIYPKELWGRLVSCDDGCLEFISSSGHLFIVPYKQVKRFTPKIYQLSVKVAANNRFNKRVKFMQKDLPD